MEKKTTLSEESAEKELEKFYEYYELDISELDDPEAKDAEEEANAAIKRMLKKMKKAVMKGTLSFNETDDGFTIIQEIRKQDSDGKNKKIHYQEMSGNSKVAMNKKHDNDPNAKIYALLGSLSSLGDRTIRELKGPDLSLAESIGSVLLLL